ncbi:MAG TPA: GatB/YqeY domain-containing protein [Aggregatilineales bacterium]|jgi:uncharacterized protein YqeY|nr:GatB/YqeY domain-containing protein [Aggregatilineales bacterium]
MSETKTRLNDAVKEAMKNKDAARRDALRMTVSAIKQIEIDTQKELSEDDVLAVLQKEAKKRRETITELTNAGRPVDSEQFELGVIEEFLPRQMSADEIKAVAQAVIAETGASSAKETGKVMGLVMARVKGSADGKLVSQVVRDLLNG